MTEIVEECTVGTGARPLLIEVAHGAAGQAEFDAVAARLEGELPADLHEFFHVNTDIGAWELSLGLAEALVERRPELMVRLIRCRIPRTFVDTNRVIDAAAGKLTEGGLTPGIPPYVRAPQDHVLLRDLHARYQAHVDEALAALSDDAAVLFVHTYAPRSVGIEQVDDAIVTNLRWAYEPEREPTWPLRPEVDLITRTPEGERVVDDAVVASIGSALAAIGRRVEEAASYTLHPATQAARRALARPGRALCFEVRRDLLVRQWRPLQPLDVDPDRVRPLAAALADALRSWV